MNTSARIQTRYSFGSKGGGGAKVVWCILLSRPHAKNRIPGLSRTAAIGLAKSYCWECPKPTEFGSVGLNWENIGWRVNVLFSQLLNKIRPRDHMEVLRAVLPDRYSPL